MTDHQLLKLLDQVRHSLAPAYRSNPRQTTSFLLGMTSSSLSNLTDQQLNELLASITNSKRLSHDAITHSVAAIHSLREAYPHISSKSCPPTPKK